MFTIEIKSKETGKVMQSIECKNFKDAVAKRKNIEFRVDFKKYEVFIVEQ